MRLAPHEAEAIGMAARDAFGPGTVVRLFGSRLDDARRGGDIDLHVVVAAEPAPDARARFRMMLDRQVGERDYDVVLAIAGRPLAPIDERALAEGLVL